MFSPVRLQPIQIFLLVVAPALAILLALLGIATIPTNPLGWFLFFTGVVYSAGIVITTYIRRIKFWEQTLSGITTHEESGDRSFWYLTAALAVIFYLSPLEYWISSGYLPHFNGMEYLGLALVICGSGLFIWARRSLGGNYSGHVSVKQDQVLVQNGPYRFIRHPAYAGYFLIALGLCIEYFSLSGLACLMLILIPVIAYRIRVEEAILDNHFGLVWREYKNRIPAILPCARKRGGR